MAPVVSDRSRAMRVRITVRSVSDVPASNAVSSEPMPSRNASTCAVAIVVARSLE